MLVQHRAGESVPKKEDFPPLPRVILGFCLDVRSSTFLVTLVGTEAIEQGKIEQIQLLCFYFLQRNGQYSGVSFVCIIKEEKSQADRTPCCRR